MTVGCRVHAAADIKLNTSRWSKLLTLNGGHVGAVGVPAQRDDVGAGDATHLHIVLAVADLYTQWHAKQSRHENAVSGTNLKHHLTAQCSHDSRRGIVS